jgi:hypothetical protein
VDAERQSARMWIPLSAAGWGGFAVAVTMGLAVGVLAGAVMWWVAVRCVDLVAPARYDGTVAEQVDIAQRVCARLAVQPAEQASCGAANLGGALGSSSAAEGRELEAA